LDNAGWYQVADCAKVHPTSEATQRVVLDELRRRENEDFRRRLEKLMHAPLRRYNKKGK
jgi:hypothetical protein